MVNKTCHEGVSLNIMASKGLSLMMRDFPVKETF